MPMNVSDCKRMLFSQYIPPNSEVGLKPQRIHYSSNSSGKDKPTQNNKLRIRFPT